MKGQLDNLSVNGVIKDNQQYAHMPTFPLPKRITVLADCALQIILFSIAIE